MLCRRLKKSYARKIYLLAKNRHIYTIRAKEKMMIANVIKTQVKFVKLPHYVDSPANLTYSTEYAACFDICAALNRPMTIAPGQHCMVPTAIKTAAEAPLWFRINSRSGLAAKNGIIAIGGIIDNDYRGEWKVILLNTTSGDYACDYVIEPGDKIAQVELPFPYRAEFVEVSEAEFEAMKTGRGEGGFGSSGR